LQVFGRDRELARVGSFLESLPTAGPAALVIDGEAGIGKTTLWRAGLDAAGERAYRLLSSRPAEADASLSFAGLADLLAGVEEEVFDLLPEPQREALDAALLRQAARGRPPEPRAVFAAFTTTLRLVATDRPALIAVDDAQWLDGPSARALAFAARRLDGAPVGLLAAVRATGDANVPAAVASVERSEWIRLEPLSPGALHRLVKERYGWSLPRPTLLRLHQACGGNAFYAIEIAGALAASGLPDARDAWPIPEDVRQLVDLRVQHLPALVRKHLLAAAAASHPTTDLFDSATLQSAREAGVVTVGQGARVRFSHPLYAAAIYTATSPAQQRALHAELARLEHDPEERARHLGLAASRPDAEVAAQLEDAADRARSRGAPETAAELEERAFELTPPSDRETAGRRALIAATDHVHAGALARADTLLTALLENAGHAAIRSSAMRLLAFVRFREESYDQAIGLMHAAAAEAGDIPELRAPVELDLTLLPLAASLDHEAARPHGAAALAYAERGSDRALLSHALAVTTMADFLLGDGLDEERLARALELEDLDEEAVPEVRPTLIAGFLAFYTGDFERARALLYPLRTRLLERGQDTDLPLLSLHLAWLECSAGDLQAARALADEGLQTAALGGSLTAHALALSALLDAHAGNVDQCRHQVQEALERMGGAEFCLVVEWSSTALGLLELSLGEASAVHRTLEFLTEFYGSREVVDPIHLAFLPDEIEALIALAEVDRAQRLTDLLTAAAVRFDRPWALATSGRCRALLLAARNDLLAAADAIEEALAEHERLSMPLEHARTLIVKGQIERRRKHKATARAALEGALAICEQIGARLWAERARAELARLGAGRGANDLTPTEERVATLAASGLTNSQVAAGAFMSQKTVEANLSRIYRKLGIRSRAELGVRLAEREQTERAPAA
jgi:DNA-binding CsgD family transcriptional regulator